MSSDRRAGGRTRVEPPVAVPVTWAGGGGEAVDVSNTAVAVRTADVSALVPGRHLADLRIERGDWAVVLADVEVVRREDDGDGGIVVFAVAGDSDRGSLWTLRDQCRRNAFGAPPDASCERPERVPGRGHYSEAARLERLEWVRERTGAELDSFAEVPFDPSRLTGNVENLVGAVSVPVGLAGPLRIIGEHVRGDVVAPFATTEGALVASATRGALAASRAGGVRVQVVRQVMTRAPAFTFADVEAAAAFGRWLDDHHDEIAAEAVAVSSYARLIALEPHQVGATVHVRFAFDTADAAGQNMTTACTWHATEWILQRLVDHPVLEPVHFMIEGNLSGDKKLNWVSPVAGRGVRVTAEVTIPGDVLLDVLKVTPAQMVQGYQVALGGTLSAGTAGYDINVANTVAAIFTATGQDIACVHESSVGIINLQVRGEDLSASMTLPCLVLGTVGGGTHLPAQRDALQMLGCDGAGHAGRLAEIVAGFCLALDLSTLAAVCGGQFVSAHERLGRNRPVDFFSRADLGPDFFTEVARSAAGDESAAVVTAEPVSADLEDSILTELSSHRVRHLVGLEPYAVRWRTSSGATGTADVVVKVKPVDAELQLLMRSLASACGDEVADAMGAYEDRLPFAGSHLRELEIYEQDDPRFRRHTPTAYRLLRDDDREAFVLVLELLRRETGAVLLPDGGATTRWDADAIDVALSGMSALHAIWLGRDAELVGTGRWGPHLAAADMKDMLPLWDVLLRHAESEFPELVPRAAARRCGALLDSVGDWWSEIEEHPRTLTHGDFNPRNICLRTDAGPDPRLCAFDWELAVWHLPQRDLAEMLAFTLDTDATPAVVDAHVETARRALEHESGVAFDRGDWRRGYCLGLYDFAVNRLMLYLMGHTVRDFEFLPRVCATTWHLLEVEASQGPGAPELGDAGP